MMIYFVGFWDLKKSLGGKEGMGGAGLTRYWVYPSKGDSGSISESVFYADFLHVKSMLQYDVHFFRFLGNGLATNVDNEAWKQRRAIMNPAFHRKQVLIVK